MHNLFCWLILVVLSVYYCFYGYIINAAGTRMHTFLIINYDAFWFSTLIDRRCFGPPIIRWRLYERCLWGRT